MASLMDLLMQRKSRGYQVDDSGPSVADRVLQREQRGYPVQSPTAARPAPVPQGQAPTPEIWAALDRMRGAGPMNYSRGLPGVAIPEAPAPLSRELTPPQTQGVQVPPNLGLSAPEAPAPLPRELMAAPRMAQSAANVGPVNLNVIRGLNQYAGNIGSAMQQAQEYANQFAGGDLSKVRARTYRDEEGNPYNDYYVKGLLG